jgi:hypothetical protein
MKSLVMAILLIGLTGLAGLITVAGVRMLSEGTLYAAEDSFDPKDVRFRLSAEFQNFDGSETFTAETVPADPAPGEGGILAYSKEDSVNHRLAFCAYPLDLGYLPATASMIEASECMLSPFDDHPVARFQVQND